MCIDIKMMTNLSRLGGWDVYKDKYVSNEVFMNRRDHTCNTM